MTGTRGGFGRAVGRVLPIEKPLNSESESELNGSVPWVLSSSFVLECRMYHYYSVGRTGLYIKR